MSIDKTLVSDLGKNTRLAKYLGVFPMEMFPQGPRMSKIGGFSSVVLVTVVLANVVFQIVSPSNCFGTSRAELSLNIFQWLLMNVTVLSLAVVTVRHGNDIHFIMSGLTSVRRAFPVGRRLHFPYKVSFFCDASIFLFMIFDISQFAFNMSELSYIWTYYYTAILTIEGLSQFMWLSFELATTYRRLRTSVCERMDFLDLEYLIKFQLELSECCKRLDQVYSLEFLLTFATASIVSLSDAFKFIIGVMRQDDPNLMAVYFGWSFINLVLCFRVINACEVLKSEAEKFNESLYEKIIQHKSDNITQPSVALNVFLHFPSNDLVKFTLYGFREVNWSLLFSGCTTYLLLHKFYELGSKNVPQQLMYGRVMSCRRRERHQRQ